MLASPLHDRPMPLPRRIGLGIEVVEVLARPKAAVIADCEITASHIEGDCIGRVGLQLEGMGTGVSSYIHKLKGPLEALVVVAAHLSDHKRWLVEADGSTGDFNRHERGNSVTAGPGKRVSMAIDPSAS